MSDIIETADMDMWGGGEFPETEKSMLGVLQEGQGGWCDQTD